MKKYIVINNRLGSAREEIDHVTTRPDRLETASLAVRSCLEAIQEEECRVAA
jgi:hypothetical protein